MYRRNLSRGQVSGIVFGPFIVENYTTFDGLGHETLVSVRDPWRYNESLMGWDAFAVLAEIARRGSRGSAGCLFHTKYSRLIGGSQGLFVALDTYGIFVRREESVGRKNVSTLHSFGGGKMRELTDFTHLSTRITLHQCGIYAILL